MTSPAVPPTSSGAETVVPRPTARSPLTGTSDVVGDAIRAANASFLEAFGRGDAAGMAAAYTADGQVMPAGTDVITGREAIEAFWRSVLALGIAGAALDSMELYHEAGARTATEVGRFTLLGADGAPVDRGKYVVVWQRDAGGRWQIHRDIWTSNQPPAPAST